MKRIIYTLALAMSGLGAQTAAAEPRNVESEGLSYVLNEDGTAEVVGFGLGATTAMKTDLKIPSTLEAGGESYMVTSIGKESFKDTQTLKSVTLPPTVVRVGDRSFDNCRSLAGVEFSEGLLTIGKFAFGGTAIEKVVLPSTVTYIDMAAFMACTSLSELELCNVSGISQFAFEGCGKLQVLTIPESVTVIGMGAFMDSGLRYLSLDLFGTMPFTDFEGIFGFNEQISGGGEIPVISVPALRLQQSFPEMAARVYEKCPEMYYGRAVIDFNITKDCSVSYVEDSKTGMAYAMSEDKSLLVLAKDSQGTFVQEVAFTVEVPEGETACVMYGEEEVKPEDDGKTYVIRSGETVPAGLATLATLPSNTLSVSTVSGVKAAPGETLSGETSEDHRVFDLQGRELSEPVPGQPYIRGGKVLVEPK